MSQYLYIQNPHTKEFVSLHNPEAVAVLRTYVKELLRTERLEQVGGLGERFKYEKVNTGFENLWGSNVEFTKSYMASNEFGVIETDTHYLVKAYRTRIDIGRRNNEILDKIRKRHENITTKNMQAIQALGMTKQQELRSLEVTDTQADYNKKMNAKTVMFKYIVIEKPYTTLTEDDLVAKYLEDIRKEGNEDRYTTLLKNYIFGGEKRLDEIKNWFGHVIKPIKKINLANPASDYEDGTFSIVSGPDNETHVILTDGNSKDVNEALELVQLKLKDKNPEKLGAVIQLRTFFKVIIDRDANVLGSWNDKFPTAVKKITYDSETPKHTKIQQIMEACKTDTARKDFKQIGIDKIRFHYVDDSAHAFVDDLKADENKMVYAQSNSDVGKKLTPCEQRESNIKVTKLPYEGDGFDFEVTKKQGFLGQTDGEKNVHHVVIWDFDCTITQKHFTKLFMPSSLGKKYRAAFLAYKERPQKSEN